MRANANITPDGHLRVQLPPEARPAWRAKAAAPVHAPPVDLCHVQVSGHLSGQGRSTWFEAEWRRAGRAPPAFRMALETQGRDAPVVLLVTAFALLVLAFLMGA